MNYNEIWREGFAKIVDWIKTEYPCAIERSYLSEIECESRHHVYHTLYLTIKDGEVYLHRGSHGWKADDAIYDSKNGVWTERGKEINTKCRNCDIFIEEFLIEWTTQKPYIEMSLRPYENIKSFKV